MAGQDILSGSVGAGGANRLADVGLVQIFLNVMRSAQKKPLLVVDGICGPLTTAAIHEFQQDFVPRSKDSRIDPQGATLRVLIYSYITIMRLGVYRMRPFPASFTLLAAQERPDGCDYGTLMHNAFTDLKRGITPLLGPRKGATPAPRGPAPQGPPKRSTQFDVG